MSSSKARKALCSGCRSVGGRALEEGTPEHKYSVPGWSGLYHQPSVSAGRGKNRIDRASGVNEFKPYGLGGLGVDPKELKKLAGLVPSDSYL